MSNFGGCINRKQIWSFQSQKEVYHVKINLLLTMLFTIVLSAEIFAQGKQVELALGGGISLPVSPDEFKDFWNIGFNGTGSIGYWITPQLTIGGNFSFNRFGINEDELRKQFGGTGLIGLLQKIDFYSLRAMDFNHHS